MSTMGSSENDPLPDLQQHEMSPRSGNQLWRPLVRLISLLPLGPHW